MKAFLSFLFLATLATFSRAAAQGTSLSKLEEEGGKVVAAVKDVKSLIPLLKNAGEALDRVPDGPDKDAIRAALIKANETILSVNVVLEDRRKEVLNTLNAYEKRSGAQSPGSAAITPAEAVAKARAEEAASVARAKAKSELANAKVAVFVRIAQVLNSGDWLGYGSTTGERKDEHGEPIYIVGGPSGWVDGDKWNGYLYPCGSYNYTTVAGGSKTVRKYALSVERAYEELRRP